jgi:hypothetical protein
VATIERLCTQVSTCAQRQVSKLVTAMLTDEQRTVLEDAEGSADQHTGVVAPVAWRKRWFR